MAKNPTEISDPDEVDKQQNFAEHLRSLRQKAGLSVEQAADAAGIPAGIWQQMEGNEAYPRFSVIRPIAQALGVAPSKVL